MSKHRMLSGGDQVTFGFQKLRFPRLPYRRDSIKSSELTDQTLEEQKQLFKNVQRVLDRVHDMGETLRNALLEPEEIQILTEAHDFLNRCIHRYLHRALISETLLPVVKMNDAKPSYFYGLPNAISIQLISLDKRFHSRLIELIHGVFLAFPTRDYCVVTIPCSAPDLPWMKYFVRVTPRTSSIYPNNMFVLHRACFSNTIRVREAREEDYECVLSFVESLYEAQKILEDFKSAVCRKCCDGHDFQCFLIEVVSRMDNPIVGFTIVGNDEKAGTYHVNYSLDRYTYYDLHDPVTDHAYVYHFIMNPIFQPLSKLVLKEVMRMLKRNCLYHCIYPPGMTDRILCHQTLLNNLEDWIPLVARRQVEYSLINLSGNKYDDLRQPPKSSQPSQIPYSVFHHAKKFTYEPKITSNKRIVFIGASDTTVSCLERIISQPYFDAKNLTLISTYGLPGSLPSDEIRKYFFPKKYGPALSMKSNEEWYQRLPIRSLVNIVYGTAMRILRKVKVVVVDNNKIVPYDLLVICTGRQFIRPDCPEAEIVDERLERFKRNVNKVDAEKPPQITVEPKPKNVFLINTDLQATQALNLLRTFIPFVSNRQIIIHGSCLEAYCCLRALIELGVSPHRITFVTSEKDEMDWEAYHSYRDTEILRELMNSTISQLGVNRVDKYEFRKWNMDEDGICSRIYLDTNIDIGETRPAKLSIPCLAYFVYCIRRIGDEMATAIASASIPFNNGILINMRFETHDSSIMSAGPCAIYDKKLDGEKYDHHKFSSYEVGQMLGGFILEKILPSAKSTTINFLSMDTPSSPPPLKAPLVHYAQLPGGWNYLHVSGGGLVPNCCRGGQCVCEICQCGTEIETGSIKSHDDPEQKYFRLRLDRYQRVDGLECISRHKFPPSCLASIFAHHAAFLNRLIEGLDKGDIKDLHSHFCQPWIAALTMDRWPGFCKEIQDLMSTYEIGRGIKITDFVRDYLANLHNDDVFKMDANILRHVFENTNLKAAIESKFLNFLKYNRAVLPMYARPDFVEETYKERLSSPFYVPLHKNFGL